MFGGTVVHNFNQDKISYIFPAVHRFINFVYFGGGTIKCIDKSNDMYHTGDFRGNHINEVCEN